MKNTIETQIWVPLIGFDRDKPDRGVAEYYEKIGFSPDAISLFVFCPDLVHHHEGMEHERVLPPDNCSYYGNICNEVRNIQPWTNHDLRALVGGLEARGAQTYMGLMGVFVDRQQEEAGHYNTGHREWLHDHKELMGVWNHGRYSLNVLKRFKDGTYYEDYFVEKLLVALRDYGFTGIHASDNFCPFGTGGSAKNGDYSDDMIGQFMAHSGIQLPHEVARAVDDCDTAGIKRRGDYIWNRHKLQWLQFMTWRWARFWGRVATALHAEGKKVMVNNAWCSEPFEAVYRYGMDYKLLHEAGVDYMIAESVPTSVHAGKDETERYHFYDYMTMPAMMKTAVPQSRVICLNSVKDSTEEWDVVNHYSSEVEREIYSLPNYYMQTAGGLQRAMDGMLICLGDGLTAGEWRWLHQRYATAFSEVPRQVLTPTLIWSDAAHDKFLPEYIETKRWPAHKTLYEFARNGAQMGAFARIEDLGHVTGPIFVPNADLLPRSEQEAIAAYQGGSIICTSLEERRFELPGGRETDFAFTDPGASYKLCIQGYGLGYIDYPAITAVCGDDLGSDVPDVIGSPRYAEDPSHWRQELVFRSVSRAFIKVAVRLIRSQYLGGLSTDLRDPLLPFLLEDGRIRVFLGNDNRTQYRSPLVRSARRIRSVVSHSTFPALPAKLVTAGGETIIPKTDGSHLLYEAWGFITKIPPGGMTILDVEFEEGA